MLLAYHTELRRIISFYFKFWSLDFLSQSRWKILNIAKLLIFPFGTVTLSYCSIWHLFFEMSDYSDLIDVSFTIAFIAAGFQSNLVYWIINVYNKKKIMNIFRYFDFLINSEDSLFSNIRKKQYLKNLKRTVTIAR